MCRIGLTLTTSVQEGLTITSATGRYRLQGTSTWTTFSINLTDPRTPNITTNGIYQLQVNVSDSSGGVSPWSPNLPATFEVSDNCGGVQGPCNFDGRFYYYDVDACEGGRIRKVRSSIPYSIGDVVETTSSINNGTIIGEDCNQSGTINIIGSFVCPTGTDCIKYVITNIGNANGFRMPPYLDCSTTADPGNQNDEGFGGQEIPLGQTLEVCGLPTLINQLNQFPGITVENLGPTFPCP